VDDDYMTSDVHHAVWKAHAEKRVDAIPECNVKRYHRAQVLALLREMEARRG
jgi:hypothetical protein